MQQQGIMFVPLLVAGILINSFIVWYSLADQPSGDTAVVNDASSGAEPLTVWHEQDIPVLTAPPRVTRPELRPTATTRPTADPSSKPVAVAGTPTDISAAVPATPPEEQRAPVVLRLYYVSEGCLSCELMLAHLRRLPVKLELFDLSLTTDPAVVSRLRSFCGKDLIVPAVEGGGFPFIGFNPSKFSTFLARLDL